jgi:hypothetical protein
MHQHFKRVRCLQLQGILKMEAASERHSDEVILSVVIITEFPCMEQEKL